MTVDHSVAVEVVVAIAILAHAWSSRIQGNPRTLSIIGWVVNALAVLALASVWVRC